VHCRQEQKSSIIGRKLTISLLVSVIGYTILYVIVTYSITIIRYLLPLLVRNDVLESTSNGVKIIWLRPLPMLTMISLHFVLGEL
jgi:hypothetical protein